MECEFDVAPRKYILNISKEDICEIVIEYLKTQGKLPAGEIKWEVSIDPSGHRVGEGIVVLRGFEKSIDQDFDLYGDRE